MAKYITVLNGALRTTTTTSNKVENGGSEKGAHIVVKVNSGSNLTVAVKGYDGVSDTDYTILTSAILVSGASLLRVGPEFTAGTNVAKDYLPARWFVVATLSGSTNFSIGASLV